LILRCDCGCSYCWWLSMLLFWLLFLLNHVLWCWSRFSLCIWYFRFRCCFLIKR
jgi:hypothetical protein